MKASYSPAVQHPTLPTSLMLGFMEVVIEVEQVQSLLGHPLAEELVGVDGGAAAPRV